MHRRNAAHTTPRVESSIPAWALIWESDSGTTKINYGEIHELIHRDISIGNDYRKERLKLLITLASGVFALTVTFHKDLFSGVLDLRGLVLLLVGWSALLLSLLCGILHFHKWEDFYLEHRAVGNAIWQHHIGDATAKAAAVVNYHAARNNIEKYRQQYRFANVLQTGLLIVGLAFIAGDVGYTSYEYIKSGPHPAAESQKKEAKPASEKGPSSP
jgi:hypothetical protein